MAVINRDSYLDNPNPKGLPVYLGSQGIRGHKESKVKETWTEWEKQEYLKCAKDFDYFTTTWYKITTIEHGLINFKLRSYQRDIVNMFENNRRSIFMSGRQTGKTEVSAAYMLWKLLFNNDFRIVSIAPSATKSQELLEGISKALEYIPFFLQPGCKKKNTKEISFSNGSKISAKTAMNSARLRGFTANIIFVDEMAFIENDELFFKSVAAIINSDVTGLNSKMIITSTPDGISNLFYKLFTEALENKNGFGVRKVEWWEVPGRDEKFRQETIAVECELTWRIEYACEFLGTSNTLISADTLNLMRPSKPIREGVDFKIFKNPIKDHKYILVVDPSEGVGIDYSAFHVIDVTEEPFEQVYSYRNSLVSQYDLAHRVNKIGLAYNSAYLVVESNMGVLLISVLWYDLEYPNMYNENVNGRARRGVFMDKRVKSLGCSNFKDLIESNKLLINDEETIKEIKTFEINGKSYAARDGFHDDLTMALVLFAYISAMPMFTEITRKSLQDMVYGNIANDVNDWAYFVGYNPNNSVDSFVDDILSNYREQEIVYRPFLHW